MTAQEMRDLRDRMIRERGTSPEEWYAELGIDKNAVLALAMEVASIAAELGKPVYAAAGTSYCMGFALGALVMREQLKAATS